MTAKDELKYILMTGGATIEREAEEAIQAALTEHAQDLMDNARYRARDAAKVLLSSLIPGATGEAFTNEIADRIVGAVFGVVVR